MKSLELTKKTISLVLGAFLFLWMQNAVAGGGLSLMGVGAT